VYQYQLNKTRTNYCICIRVSSGSNGDGQARLPRGSRGRRGLLLQRVAAEYLDAHDVCRGGRGRASAGERGGAGDPRAAPAAGLRRAPGPRRQHPLRQLAARRGGVQQAGLETVPTKCERYVGNYMLGGHYRRDSRIVIDEAIAYAESLKLAGNGKEAWVFDIDETSLSNLPYYATHGFG
jgi:hypothetical protein